ncbi:putative chromatin regulator PHD family [Medicago truncatula]|uniref:Cysteine/histidine-rich C1 domain protein n=1 Tax=Medicago truncatula TaxID=3880 RepID=G7KXX0_MEDTR|nr:uncharacterized protein LOC11438862 [Medicago truncatula]AES78135.1 cysteine/histidine-rich C1 domain protein [Medicago truncatula]RHN44810.1 putative chromatin regulator PHD family [Medicago truncatula]
MDHEHSLQRKPPGAPYTCTGCGELGFGSSYHCENINCSYVLHEVCANPDPYAFHPFFEKSYFEFHRKPPGYKTRYCNACGKDVLGFVYHCSSTDYDLHPCCLKLQHSISDDNGNVTLNLSKRVHSKCGKCKHKHVMGKVQGWSYYDGNSCYHVSCFKDLILQNWRMGYFSEGDREAQLVLTRSRRTRTMSKYTKIAVVIFKLLFSAIFGNPISAVFTLASN